jgi:hypothetical protein
MHHTCAYGATVASAAETDIAALADSVLVIQNGHFLPQRPSDICYAAFAALLGVYARLSTPTLSVITPPYIRDISLAVDFGNPQILADYSADMLHLEALEELTFTAKNSAATSGLSLGIIGLMIQQIPQPGGKVFTIRGTAVATLVINAWTQLGTITWQNQLPTGIFACIGAEAFSAGAKAFRLTFENQVWRPGGLGMLLETNRTHPLFRMGNLGQWGAFHNYAMPTFEMISASADTAEVVYMDIVRLS